MKSLRLLRFWSPIQRKEALAIICAKITSKSVAMLSFFGHDHFDNSYLFQDFIRETARSFIARTDIEAYTATLNKNSDPLPKSLFKLTKVCIPAASFPHLNHATWSLNQIYRMWPTRNLKISRISTIPKDMMVLTLKGSQTFIKQSSVWSNMSEDS
jgi:hypothetical protein